MGLYTRKTHTVRIKSADGRFFADVEVLDAVSLQLPNAGAVGYVLGGASGCVPCIIDKTGDGNDKGDPTNSGNTRISHMQRLTGPNGQFFDVEVCDAFTVTGPNQTPHAVVCPPTLAQEAITDNTGNGLGTDYTPGTTTRTCHVVELINQVGGGGYDPGASGGGGGQAGGAGASGGFALQLLTDAIIQSCGNNYGMPYDPTCIAGTAQSSPAPTGNQDDDNATLDESIPLWWNSHALQFMNPSTIINGALAPSAQCNDTTQYITDPDTGATIPPPNNDPNVYVFFPPGTSGPFIGAPSGGAQPYGAGASGQGVIDMGPIWWIRKLGSTVNVWYWYVSPVQQPLVWSYFGPCPNSRFSGSWGYVGWQLLPFTTVTWILNDGAHGNYSQVPLGTMGADSLVAAASGYTVSGASGGGGGGGGSGASGVPITTNWFGTAIPDGGFRCSTTAVATGAYGSGLPMYTYTLINLYMPFGALPMTDGTSDEVLAYAESKGGAAPYRSFGGPPPNIWQLTGLPQPPLTDPSRPWDPTNNPHLTPSIIQAKQAAQTFAELWNETANGINNAMQSFNGKNISPEDEWPIPGPQPPGWAWKVPYPGGGTNAALGFHSNILPFMVGNGVPLGTWYPATIPTIAVDQLDPSVWDNAPPNFDVTGPVQWATGVP